MKKNISINYGGSNSRVGEFIVNRLVPNQYVQKVGPFVFLDHLYPKEYPAGIAKPFNGENAHPHRGIATFTYVFSGEFEHFDSRGNKGIVGSGGAQWMKSGNGIIHEEYPSVKFQERGGILHAAQFWINLPSRNKHEEGEYLAVHSADIPQCDLPDHAGVIRAVIGKLGDQASPVQTYTEQFIYNIRLNAKASYTFKAQAGLEYAAFIPKAAVNINSVVFENSDLVIFQPEGDEIVFANESVDQTEFLLFGGARYEEPIVAEGPFVMNSQEGISEAYRDFFSGKYGTIDY